MEVGLLKTTKCWYGNAIKQTVSLTKAWNQRYVTAFLFLMHHKNLNWRLLNIKFDKDRNKCIYITDIIKPLTIF